MVMSMTHIRRPATQEASYNRITDGGSVLERPGRCVQGGTVPQAIVCLCHSLLSYPSLPPCEAETDKKLLSSENITMAI